MIKNQLKWGQQLIVSLKANLPFQSWIDEVTDWINSPDLPMYTVTTLPAPREGGFIYLSDINRTAHSDGNNWYRSDTGAQV